MNGFQYFLKCLKNYAAFTGRARRKEYWYFVLFYMTLSIPFSIIDLAFDIKVLGSIYSLAMTIPFIAVSARRMHDTGKSGWYMLIPIYSLVLCCTDGEKGYNTYGQDPKKAPEEGFDFDNNKFS